MRRSPARVCASSLKPFLWRGPWRTADQTLLHLVLCSVWRECAVDLLHLADSVHADTPNSGDIGGFAEIHPCLASAIG